MPVRIIGIAGSLRVRSNNAMLLQAAVASAGDAATIDVASIVDIPLYNFDVEEQGIPGAVTALKERIAAADGLLLVTPEYNNSLPGVLKNAIDWLTRPASDIPRVFHDLPVAVIGASNGQGGTGLAQLAWLPVLRTLRMKAWFGGRLQLPNADEVFDESGRIVDEGVRKRIERFVRGFAQFVDENRRKERT